MQERLQSVMAWAAETVGALQVVLLVSDAEASGLRPLAHWGNGQPPESYASLARRALEGEGAKALRGQELAASHPASGPQTAIIATPIPAEGSPPAVLVALVPQTSPEQLAIHQARLHSLAELAAGLLESAALREVLRHREEQLHQLVRANIEAQETERQRISMEVHDGITQTLTSAFHYSQALEELTQDNPDVQRLTHRTTALIRQAIQECRAVINDLRPPTLHPDGLVATLRHEAHQMEADSRWKISLDADPVTLPAEVETNLYRIVQEALANVRKHADTGRAWIRLRRLEDGLVIEVRDRGRGFDPQAVEATPGRKGLGLLSMRQRAELLRGTCTVESRPSRGTTVRVEIPLPR